MLKRLIAVLAVMFGLVSFASIPAQADVGSGDGASTHSYPGRKASGASAKITGGPYWYWIGGQQNLPSTGTGADGAVMAMDISSPQFNTVHDYHTLAEVSVADTTTNQRVEIGWTKSTTECSPPSTTATNSCLFVFRWDNTVGKGYNLSGGFTLCNGSNGCTLAPGVALGTSVASASTVKFGWIHTGTWPTGAWWAVYGNTVSGVGGYLGYYLDSLWAAGGPTFGKAYEISAFGEVASAQQYPTASPCSGMGSNVPGANAAGPPSAARVGNYTLTGSTTPAQWTLFENSSISGQPLTPYYSYAQLGFTGTTWNGTGFYFGGDNTSC